MKDLWVSWDEYHRLIETLTMQVYESGYKFDCLLCLARGGLRVGDVISRVYDMPLAILAASSYREAAGTEQVRGRLLLVDDLVDSGATLHKVIDHLRSRYPGITEVRTAVLWWKAVSKFKPDFFVQYLETSPWIHQPFEEYDTLRPNQLAPRLRSKVG